ncbi:MAG: winged helix-turn-helix domain-containing protein [Phycisphaeraceae bacterium]|nr:winged helix-turn-helix domain-containing protein [Phycisphaeraceae bacterium]
MKKRDVNLKSVFVAVRPDKVGKTAKKPRKADKTRKAAPAEARASQATGAVPKPPKTKKPSGLDAAAQVLKASGGPMRCKDIVQTMLDKGLWKTGGKTPHATIYAAIHREIQTKGANARFRKVERGRFTLAKGA